jgi:hypothetical protein
LLAKLQNKLGKSGVRGRLPPQGDCNLLPPPSYDIVEVLIEDYIFLKVRSIYGKNYWY